MASAEKRKLEYEDMESDYKEIERLENILNNEYFILINKDNKLSEDYVPNNLKKSEAKFLDYVQDNNLENAAADAVKKSLLQRQKMVFHWLEYQGIEVMVYRRNYMILG